MYISKEMTSEISITDFVNLLQPGQLTDIGITIKSALSKVTITTMQQIPAANIKKLTETTTTGSIVPIITSATSTALAATARSSGSSNYSADIKKITDAYKTFPTFLTAYTVPTNLPPPRQGSSGSAQGPLATTNSSFNDIITFLKKTFDDFGSVLLFSVIQQNASKNDTATLTALTGLIVSYINYLGYVVATFKLDPGSIDPKYDAIIESIEKTLGKMDITLPSITTVDVKALNVVVEPTVVTRVLPSGQVNLNTSNGFDTTSGFSPQFPTTTQIICQPTPLDPKTNRGYSPAASFRAPPIGSKIAPVTNGGGLPFLQPNTTVVNVQANYPLPNSPTTMGYLITIDKPLIGSQVAAAGNVWVVQFTYPPIPEETAAFDKYNRWLSSSRPIPDPIIVEIGKSINISINNIVTGAARPSGATTKTLAQCNNQDTINTIKTIPTLIDDLAMFVAKNEKAIFKLPSINNFVKDEMAKIYPLPNDTKKYFTELNSQNFQQNLTNPTNGILKILIPNYTSNYSLNIIKKMVNKANGLSDGPMKVLASSICTKIIKLHVAILNALIRAFYIDLSSDITIQPLLDIFTPIFSMAKFNITTTVSQAGGRRNKRKTRANKIKRRCRRQRSVKYRR